MKNESKAPWPRKKPANDGPMPLVSVVVPTFNQARYLPIALDSVMFQDYPNLEIIICNHGSTDGTREVIAAYMNEVESDAAPGVAHYDFERDRLIRQRAPRYPRRRDIIALQSATNIGGTRSYNRGFRMARGELCMYLVGDDYLLPTAISDLVAGIVAHAADVAYADMWLVNDQGRVLREMVKPEYSFSACLENWFHLGVCRLYRRALHDAAGYYDPAYRLANDYDMLLRFAMAGASFIKVNKTLYCKRDHAPGHPDEPASWRGDAMAELMRESVACARRAREWAGTRDKAT